MTQRLPLSHSKASRAALGALTLATAATTLSGCMYLSPDQTTKSYIASDGTTAKVGDVQLQNVLIVTSDKGQPGTLSGLAVNNSQAPVKLTISSPGAAKREITIAGSTAVRLDGKPNGDDKAAVSPAVSISSVASQPGLAQQVVFSTPGSGPTQVQVPIMLDQPPYGSAEPSHPTFTPPPTTGHGE
ncbi:hypothetical protein HJ588_00900 [Flexivirga sp. ID2601S]|uniref:Lipoprotein n=1 Tax=Flexivirga aerilata TaxID=1656889 RepID=A0A849ADK2_9MICO|nr:hypothetical protein [Flexivirga aerilata]NNG37833.1 hypothetical protein [Flexivirga aerilata]